MLAASVFWLHAHLSMSFLVAFLVYSFAFSKWRTCWMAPINVHKVFCVVISWVNGWKHENLLQFNTSWLASLRMWYLYFKLCFSSSCSGYDLTLIKKWRTLNCYSFLQIFLLKTKTYKLVVGNCGSPICC